MSTGKLVKLATLFHLEHKVYYNKEFFTQAIYFAHKIKLRQSI
jgi:hypothetical protein